MCSREALITCGLAGLLLVLAACADEHQAAERFAFALRARGARGAAVAGVQAWADGRSLGATSDIGMLHAELRGREGAAVELTAACPPGHRTEPASRKLVLRRVRSAGRLELAVDCRPLERTAALVVLASGDAGALPIRVRGEVAGQTELDGTAHLLVSAPPHTSLRVELDTSARPDLHPRNPVHTFRLGDDDSILLVEQSFAPPRPRARPVRRPTRPVPAPPRPQRLD